MCCPTLHLDRQEPAWCSPLHSLRLWQFNSTLYMTKFGADYTNVKNARNQIRGEELRTWEEGSANQWKSHCLIRVCG